MDRVSSIVVMHAEAALRDAENLEDRARLAYFDAKDKRRQAQANLDRVRRIAAGPRVESAP